MLYLNRTNPTTETSVLSRDAGMSSQHPTEVNGTPPRKPARLIESALSSGESTAGESSQQSQNSQRSVVYLHAATGIHIYHHNL